MHELAQAGEAIATTTKKTEKVRILAEYLRSRNVEEAAISAVFLSGRAFPAFEETTLQVGGSLLWQVIKEISRQSDVAMTVAYRRHGDLGAASEEVLHGVAPEHGSLGVLEVANEFRRIAGTRGPAAKAALLCRLLVRVTAAEAKYLVKIITGDLRIGLKESLVEEAIAKAYGQAIGDVQRANMLLGDIGETLRLAQAGRLADARMRLFHPLGFMLASPVETAAEAFTYFEHAAVEDKYDGIRAQVHSAKGGVRLFSRTLDDVTASFPELIAPLAAFDEDVILDGEIVAWQHGRALPFSHLQQRLGRKTVSEKLLREVPVAYAAFDVLYVGGELVIHRPLRERAALLDRVFASARPRQAAPVINPQGKLVFEPAIAQETAPGEDNAQVIRAPVLRADSAEDLERIFEQALERGNEGLMIKDLNSSYAPGRRGRSWLKLKRELATLDVVVTAAEYGHGKRVGVLSDYTFAVRDGERLANIGKAYSGLTDKEIADLTQWFLAHTLVDHGFVRQVEPGIVLEVAFNAIMLSERHDSGYALRFPRILRIRSDKSPQEIDTLDRVREIFERQQLSYPSAR